MCTQNSADGLDEKFASFKLKIDMKTYHNLLRQIHPHNPQQSHNAAEIQRILHRFRNEIHFQCIL